ncbi:hypothetical protein [Streptacidiphilus sp. EB129]|uniref:hypothetical protein n=1 Tax=Streptacidiphilus sp. EB129 TaxID=3156262 RepID=UPI003516DFB7
MGQSSVGAAMIYQHARAERDQKIAAGIDDAVKKIRHPASPDRADSASGARRLNWSGQQRTPGPLAWGFPWSG